MNYYPHHIGDFNNATRHLSRLERGIYRDLIELYYDTEQPLTLDIAALCRRILAQREDEPLAVEVVLNEFFIATPDGWLHERCEAEIAAYYAKADRARTNGVKGGRPKKTQPVISGFPNETQTKANQNHNQNHNQEPIKEKTPPVGDLFIGIDSQVVSDFKAMRSKLKAPITKTAIDGIQRESDKAGLSLEGALRLCCERNWRGFKAEWVSGQQARASPTYQTAADKQKSFADALTGRNRERTPTDFIDLN